MTIEWGKLGVLMTTVVGCFGVIITKTAEPEHVWPLITLIIGYATGNGRLASKGGDHVPMIGRSEDGS